MSKNKFKICVSLATNSTDKLPSLITKAIKKRADFFEIRFDHIIYNDIDKALEMSSRIKDRAIFTLRSKSEGGFFKGDRKEQIVLIKKMAAIGPMLLDIDLSLLKQESGLRRFLMNGGIQILVSSHNFKNTPNTVSLLKKFQDMSKYSNNVKLVTTARTVEDNFKILSLYDNRINTNLVAFAMGEFGILSRMLCTLYGRSPFTYASLNNPLAPGQLDIDLMKKVYTIIGNNLKNK